MQDFLSHPPGILFDELLNIVRTFAVNGAFDDDICLVGMDYLGMPPVKA